METDLKDDGILELSQEQVALIKTRFHAAQYGERKLEKVRTPEEDNEASHRAEKSTREKA